MDAFNSSCPWPASGCRQDQALPTGPAQSQGIKHIEERPLYKALVNWPLCRATDFDHVTHPPKIPGPDQTCC